MAGRSTRSLGVMDPVFRYFGLLILVTVVSALAWHIVVKRWIAASLGAAFTTAVVAPALLEGPSRPLTADSLLSFAILFTNGLIFALAIGIPFNRRRNPIRATHLTPALSSEDSIETRELGWKDIVVMLSIGAVLAYFFLRVGK